MTPAFIQALYAALWYETGGTFNPNDPACVNGTDRRKCGTSGGPDDRGGNTKYGISTNANPGVDIDRLTLAQAAQIYWQKYWLASGCDKLPVGVAQYVFDIACGSGPRQAVKMLQCAVGAVADGAFGPATLAAVRAHEPGAVLVALKAQRLAFYRQIAANNASQAKFLPGWTNRANGFMPRVASYANVTGVPAWAALL